MLLRHVQTVVTKCFITGVLIALSVETKHTQESCPIGYDLAFTKDKDPICYRLKGPEKFEDKFVDCSGNLYTTKLYNSLNFTKPEYRFWAEHKTLYPGGPFVDWSYSDSTGDIMTKTFEVNYNEDLLKEDVNLCTVSEPRGNFTAVRCNEEHYRFCFVKPYEDMKFKEGCADLEDYWRFWTPRSACIGTVPSVGGGSVRATWSQAQELCSKRGGSLLQRGWRYANNKILHQDGETNTTEPLGIIMTTADNLLWLDALDGSHKVPDSEWSFRDEVFAPDTSMVALRENSWHLVNSSYIFYNVICERPILLKNVTLKVNYGQEGQLSLFVNDSAVDEKKLWCFSDSVVFYPSKVYITRVGDTDEFILKPLADGYYWCIHADTVNYRISESNKELFIREKTSVMHLYAVKIKLKKRYNFENIETLLRSWTNRLSEYIFYWSKYRRVYGKSGGHDLNEGILKRFKEKNPGIKYKDANVINFLKIRRVFLDGRTALLHIQLNPEMEAVVPGFWDGLEVIYMKPTYYCNAFNNVPMTPLGDSITINCRTYSCIGNFNEGVQWVETAAKNCSGNTTFVETPININDQNDDGASQKSKLDINVVRSVNQSDYASRDSSGSSEEITAYNNQQSKSISPFSKSRSRTTPTATSITSTSLPVMTTTIPIVTTTTPFITTTTPFITTTTPYITTTTPYITTTTKTTLTTTESSDSSESTELPDPFLPTTKSPPVTTVNTPITHPPSTTTPLPSTRPPTPTSTVASETPTTVAYVQPDEQLQDVMNSLQQLVANQTVISVEEINDAFDKVESLLEIEESLDIPGDFLHLLDDIGAKADLNGSNVVSTVRRNVALVVTETTPETPIRGLRIASRQEEDFNNSAFNIISELNSTVLSANESEAVIHLPESVAVSDRRVSFVVFRNDRAFQPASGYQLFDVNSRVISVNIENITSFNNSEVIDLHFRPNLEAEYRNNSRVCAYWHFFEDGTGMWSQEGCSFIPASEDGLLDTCRCDHLTHFAEVLVPTQRFSDTDEAILEILSIIGCVVSIFGILMICLTAALFRSWRRDFSNKIWLQLCIAILTLSVCFLIIVFAKFNGYSVACMLVGVALHYSVLASFCWMLVAAILSYKRLVLVFTREASHKLLRACAFAWGTPCAIVGILLSISPNTYTGRFEEMTPSGSFCYPSDLALWLAVYAPIALMLLANWTLFILIVRSVFATRGIQRHGDTNEALRCASVSCLLVFLFGLPWIFGLFANNVVMAYFFTLTATLQGFVLFIFFVLGNKKTRDLWLNKLKIKQIRKVPVTSSTYTNKSWRGGSGAASMEANSSKPRSLTSPDDSRFS